MWKTYGRIRASTRPHFHFVVTVTTVSCHITHVRSCQPETTNTTTDEHVRRCYRGRRGILGMAYRVRARHRDKNKRYRQRLIRVTTSWWWSSHLHILSETVQTNYYSITVKLSVIYSMEHFRWTLGIGDCAKTQSLLEKKCTAKVTSRITKICSER